MISRILIAISILSQSLIAQQETKWSTLEKVRNDQESTGLSIHKEWKDLSHAALKADKRDPRKIEVERSFNKEANEFSSSVDCGVICDLPKIGLQIKAKIHYFFEGDTVPNDLGDSITVTFLIKGQDSGGIDFFTISNLEPDFATKKANVFRPKIDGIGSINEKTWSYSLLAIISEVDSRRLLTEEVDRVDLGAFTMTRADLIHQGLKAILLDLDDRRKVASAK